MFWVHFSNRPDFVQSRFGILLMIKMTLAFAVLGVFMASLSAAKRGKMDLCRFRYTHRIVAGLMLAIVPPCKFGTFSNQCHFTCSARGIEREVAVTSSSI